MEYFRRSNLMDAPRVSAVRSRQPLHCGSRLNFAERVRMSSYAARGPIRPSTTSLAPTMMGTGSILAREALPPSPGCCAPQTSLLENCVEWREHLPVHRPSAIRANPPPCLLSRTGGFLDRPGPQTRQEPSRDSGRFLISSGAPPQAFSPCRLPMRAILIFPRWGTRGLSSLRLALTSTQSETHSAPRLRPAYGFSQPLLSTERTQCD